MACLVCRSPLIPGQGAGCPKCTLATCAQCATQHTRGCEGWCDGKCRTCSNSRPLVKCARCSNWICTTCMDNEFGGPCCLYCAIACRRSGVSVHHSSISGAPPPAYPAQPRPQAPVDLFEMPAGSNGGRTSAQPPPPPPPPSTPPPATYQQQPAAYWNGAPNQGANTNNNNVHQPRPTGFNNPGLYQQPLLQPYQLQNSPPVHANPPTNGQYVAPPAATFVAKAPPSPVVGSPHQPNQPPQPAAAVAPAPAVAVQLPGPLLTIMSTLPEKAGRLLDNCHMNIGDYGEVFCKDNDYLEGLLRGVSGDFAVFELEGGGRKLVPLTNIFSFVKNEQKSKSAASVVTSGPQRTIIKGSFIGGGAQGQVYKARYEDEREERIVVKELNFKAHEVAQAEAQEQKARELMHMRHEHLIQYLDVQRKNPTQLWIVMPFYKENDMVNFLENLRKPLTEYQLCSLVLQISSALHFLHTRNPPRLHRDVKLDNILMFDNGTRTMLVDMDFSRTMPENSRAAMSRVGTYEYMAPEVEKGRSSPASDMWSVGVIMYVLLIMPDTLLMRHPNGTTMPFNSPDWTQDVLDRTLRAEAAASAARRRIQPYNPDLIALMCALLNKEEQKRPSAQETKERLEMIMIAGLQ